MGEFFKQRESEPSKPELMECQKDMKALCDEILELQDESFTNGYDLRLELDPAEVHETLSETRAGDLLLAGADVLSAPVRSEYDPGISLYAEEENLKSVHIGAWGQEYHQSPSRVRSSEHENWVRELEISFFYSYDDEVVVQSLTMNTASDEAELPYMVRDVKLLTDVSARHENHNQTGRYCEDQAEAAGFVAFARELFKNRSGENSEENPAN